MVLRASIFGTYFLRLLAIWAIIHGFLTALGGMSRWGSHVYDVVRLVPGSPFSWGVLLALGGALVLFASTKGIDYIHYKKTKNIGLWIIALWTLLFAVGVILAAMGHPEVSLAACTRDLLLCTMAVLMTKATEPRYIKNDSQQA